MKLKVYNPAGVVELSTQRHAPRLPDLNGKIVCELSNGKGEVATTFGLIRSLLRERFPDIKIMPFTDFPVGSEQIDREETIDLGAKKRGQAVIVGNAV